jgi:hypothetical protein
MNALLMPPWMKDIKAEQDAGLLNAAMGKQLDTARTALIRSEAFNMWKAFIRELAIQADLCQQLRGIGKSLFVPIGEGENSEKEYRLMIFGSGPLAVARICVIRFCQGENSAPNILCICQDQLRDDFHIRFLVDEEGKICLLTDRIATPMEAASYVIEPIVRSFTGNL